MYVHCKCSKCSDKCGIKKVGNCCSIITPYFIVFLSPLNVLPLLCLFSLSLPPRM